MNEALQAGGNTTKCDVWGAGRARHLAELVKGQPGILKGISNGNSPLGTLGQGRLSFINKDNNVNYFTELWWGFYKTKYRKHLAQGLVSSKHSVISYSELLNKQLTIEPSAPEETGVRCVQPPLLGPDFESVHPRKLEQDVACSEPGSFSNLSCPIQIRMEHPVFRALDEVRAFREKHILSSSYYNWEVGRLSVE